MLPLREQLLKTANTYIEAHNNIDLDGLRAIYAPSCVHRVSPSPISAIFPTCNNDESVAFTAEMFKIWHKFQCRQFTEPVVDEGTRKVVLFVESKGEADAGMYENEYVIKLKMNQDGTLIEDRLEFFDSQRVIEWVARLGQVAQNILGRVDEAKTAA